MPTSPMSEQNGQFVFDHTVTTAGEYTAILSTQNTFVDKNIGIKITTPTAPNPALNLTNITSSITMGTPTNGVYSPSASISGTINFATAGWVGTGNYNVSDSNVKIGTINQSTVTISATEQATAPTLINANTSNTRDVTGSASTTTSTPQSGYFITLQANAPATPFTSLTADVTPGYLASASGVSINSLNGITTTHNSATYYFPITTGHAEGDSASITKDTTSSGNNATNVTEALLSETGSTDKPTASNSYYIALNATGNSQVTTAGWFPTGALDPGSGKRYFTLTKAAITASSSDVSATTYVDPGDITIAGDTTDITNKVRLNTNNVNDIYYKPVTTPNNIDTYYIAISAIAAPSTINGTSSITGNITASVSTPGYAHSNLTGPGSVSGTATAIANEKNSPVYYIPLPSATFTNSATNDVTYTDISSSAPELISGDYLYINKGFTDNVKIALAQLIPDVASVNNLAGDYILHGYSAYNNAGTLITGTMQDVTPTLYADITAPDGAFATQYTGLTITVTPKYKNSTAGYLEEHSSYQLGTPQTYYLKKTSLSGNGGNVTLVVDNTQTNSIYQSTSNPVVSVANEAPAADTNFVYFKVVGSGTAKNSTAGWLTANSSATGNSTKYIKIVKYDGSFTTGSGS